MDKLLLVVEDSFQISGRGVVVEPPPPLETLGINEHSPVAQVRLVRVAQVRLVRPDATHEVVEATFGWTHFNPGGFRFTCMLVGMKKEAVPPGTEMWLLDA